MAGVIRTGGLRNAQRLIRAARLTMLETAQANRDPAAPGFPASAKGGKPAQKIISRHGILSEAML
ncbi:hypothetical protein ACH6CV_02450 [Bacillota bacterium Meth-B3]